MMLPKLVIPLRDEVQETWHLINFDGEHLFIDGERCDTSSPLRNAIIRLLLTWEDHYEGVEEKCLVTSARKE